MKKSFSTALAAISFLVLFSACSFTSQQEKGISETGQSEILFRSIPWGSTSSQVAELITADCSIPPLLSNDAYLLFPEGALTMEKMAPNAGNTLIASGLIEGGYNVYLANLYFSYSVLEDGTIDKESDRLYLVTCQFDSDDHVALYDSLRQDLSKLYGKDTQTFSTGGGIAFERNGSETYSTDIKESTWAGADETFATLRCVTSENESDAVQLFCGVSLVYGNRAAEQDLKQIIS